MRITNPSQRRYPHPRPEITERILARGLKLCPDLAPPEIRAEREPTVDDLRPLILDVGVGFRPYRNGGVRVGVEWMDSSPLKDKGKKVPVVFNYGSGLNIRFAKLADVCILCIFVCRHGGNGYQAAWGSAIIALEYLEGALKNRE